MTPYEFMGLTENCLQEDILKQYRVLAKQYHPDRGGSPEKFAALGEAYRYLKQFHIDPRTRQAAQTHVNKPKPPSTPTTVGFKPDCRYCRFRYSSSYPNQCPIHATPSTYPLDLRKIPQNDLGKAYLCIYHKTLNGEVAWQYPKSDPSISHGNFASMRHEDKQFYLVPRDNTCEIRIMPLYQLYQNGRAVSSQMVILEYDGYLQEHMFKVVQKDASTPLPYPFSSFFDSLQAMGLGVILLAFAAVTLLTYVLVECGEAWNNRPSHKLEMSLHEHGHPNLKNGELPLGIKESK